jgi:hypothetical protein
MAPSAASGCLCAWEGVHDPVGGHLACQGADVAALECLLGPPQGDFNCLLAVGGSGAAVVAFLAESRGAIEKHQNQATDGIDLFVL